MRDSIPFHGPTAREYQIVRKVPWRGECHGESDSFALALQELASIRAFFGVLKHGFSFHDDSLLTRSGTLSPPYTAVLSKCFVPLETLKNPNPLDSLSTLQEPAHRGKSYRGLTLDSCFIFGLLVDTNGFLR